MKNDIVHPTIKNVAVAIVQEKNELNEEVWNVYILNLQNKALEQVLVSSRGYLKSGEENEVKTTVLRHSLGNIEAKSYVKIEPIMPELFALHNEYWVSYFKDNSMYDKKYIFLAETIKQDNFINIPILNKKGVMIK